MRSRADQLNPAIERQVIRIGALKQASYSDDPCYNHEHPTVPSVSSHLLSDMRISTRESWPDTPLSTKAHGNVIHVLEWTHSQLAAHSSGPAESRSG
jgi:hypothetical protein